MQRCACLLLTLKGFDVDFLFGICYDSRRNWKSIKRKEELQYE